MEDQKKKEEKGREFKMGIPTEGSPEINYL